MFLLHLPHIGRRRRKKKVPAHLSLVMSRWWLFLAQNLDARSDCNEGHAASAVTLAFAATMPFFLISASVDSILSSHVIHTASSRSWAIIYSFQVQIPCSCRSRAEECHADHQAEWTYNKATSRCSGKWSKLTIYITLHQEHIVNLDNIGPFRIVLGP